jgi:hypothetical protein
MDVVHRNEEEYSLVNNKENQDLRRKALIHGLS